MVRVGVVLVTHAQQEGNIPGVYAKHVVELVYTQLLHFGGIPVLHALLRKPYAFKILCYIGVSEYFENVARLVAVVNPGLVSLHNVPEVPIAKIKWGF